jgi:hypothetical protein
MLPEIDSIRVVTCTGEHLNVDTDELRASAARIARSGAEQLADSAQHPWPALGGRPEKAMPSVTRTTSIGGLLDVIRYRGSVAPGRGGVPSR